MVVLVVGQNLSESRPVGSVSGGEIGCLIVAWWIIVVVKLLISQSLSRIQTMVWYDSDM